VAFTSQEEVNLASIAATYQREELPVPREEGVEMKKEVFIYVFAGYVKSF
jgi:hypothetical protein